MSDYSLGKIAFAAFNAAEPMPISVATWDDIEPSERAAWQAAAMAVLRLSRVWITTPLPLVEAFGVGAIDAWLTLSTPDGILSVERVVEVRPRRKGRVGLDLYTEDGRRIDIEAVLAWQPVNQPEPYVGGGA